MSRMHPNRLGCFNFWYHTDSQLEFADGKLFIRGANGSGKTITTSMAVPLLMDGDSSPSRLDPMQSRDRQLIDLLLGEEHVNGKEEATGYLYLEYKKGDACITTGMGMHGVRKTRKLDKWYFLVLDGRRIGLDFPLYTEEYIGGKMKRIVYNKQALKEALGPRNFFSEHQSEYMQAVNDHIYKFDNVDAFKDLVELLLNLRSPKLSRDLKPGVVNDIMSASLPELTNEELQPLTETIEIIDRHESRLQKTNAELDLLSDLSRAYDAYSEFVAYEIAKETENAQKKFFNLRKESEQLDSRLATEMNLWETRKAESEQASRELHVEKAKSSALKSNSTLEQLKLNKGMLASAHEDKKRKSGELQTKRSILSYQKRQLQEHEAEQARVLHDIDGLLRELADAAEEINFSEHVRLSNHYESLKDSLNVPFEHWSVAFKEYHQLLKHARQQIQVLQTMAQEEQEKLDALEIIQQRCETLMKKITQHESELEKTRNDFISEVLAWNDAQKHVLLTNEEKAHFRTAASELYLDQTGRDGFDQWRNKAQNERESRIANQIGLLKIEARYLREQADEVSSRISKLRAMEEMTPDWSEAEKAQQTSMRDAGIPFVHFYEAVEFREEIDEASRRAIESAVTQSGLLSSLIVRPQDENAAVALAVVAQRKAKKPSNASAYFHPFDGGVIGVEIIQQVLEGISIIPHEEGYILDSGEFSSSWGKGMAPATEYCFIGKSAREALRMQKIHQLEAERDTLKERIGVLEQQMQQFKKEQLAVIEAFGSLPQPSTVERVSREWKDARSEWRNANDEFVRKQDGYEKCRVKVQTFRQEVLMLTRNIAFGVDAPQYELALKRCDDYREALNDLKTTRKEYEGLIKLVQAETRNIENLKGDVDSVQAEVDDLEGDIQKLSKIVEGLEQQLAEAGLSDIQQQIENSEKRIEKLDEEIKKYREEIGKLKNSVETLTGQKEELGIKLIRHTELLHAWEAIFRNEKRRGTVPFEWNEKEVVEHWSRVYANVSRAELQQEISNYFYPAQQELHDYKPSLRPFEGTDNDERTEVEWQNLKEKTKRLELSFLADYREVTARTLLDRMTEKRNDLQELIQAEEQELYTKVLIDDIGGVIVRRIQKVRAWTDEINDVLGGMTTNIKVNLEWIPIRKQSEEEISVNRLVEILSRQSEWLTADDIEKVSEHFKFRIERARRFNKQDHQFSLFQSIREILDYRKWFEFKIHSQKIGEPEMGLLTDKVFNRYSNGEKAMSIYMPLLAAISAKYGEAALDSPRFISLDEAFAGVDPNNTGELFGLIHKLKFDYIMNAFGLWGCYQDVDKLSIIEILRPINSSTAVFARYYWDGTRRYDLEDGQTLRDVTST